MDTMKKNKDYSRVRISNKTLAQLEPLLKQFKDEFSDMIGSKKDDVIDIILTLRSYALSEKEIVEIRQEKFTAVQRAKWLLKRVSEGGTSCSVSEFDALMKQIRSSKKEKKTAKNTPSKEGVLP